MPAALQTERGLNFLLASQEQSKIMGTIGAVREVIQRTHGKDSPRDFLVVRDSTFKPGKVVTYELWQRGPTQNIKQSDGPVEQDIAMLPPQYHSASQGNVLIVARHVPEITFPTQSVVEEGLRNFEQGFQGALEKIDAVKSLNEASPVPLDYDYVIGIKNAQVVFRDKDPHGKPIEITEIIDFVVVENKQGTQKSGHTAGVSLGYNHGADHFIESEKTGLLVPAGQRDSLGIPQHPYTTAKAELYSQAELLVPPLATALYQL